MTELTDFGVQVEAENQRNQCQAFDHHGDRCPYVRESNSRFCAECSSDDALVTVAELRADRPGNKGVYYLPTGVRDALRDKYDFDPLDAIVLASGSVLSTCYVLEGRLAWAAADDDATFSVCGHTYTVERGYELLAKIRERVESSTFIEKWGEACLLADRGKIRCSNPRRTATVCDYHRTRDEADEHIRIDEHLDTVGPAQEAMAHA